MHLKTASLRKIRYLSAIRDRTFTEKNRLWDLSGIAIEMNIKTQLTPYSVVSTLNYGISVR